MVLLLVADADIIEDSCAYYNSRTYKHRRTGHTHTIGHSQ